MYKCNDLISLSVLSLFEGDLIGVVDKLYFDKKLKKLLEIEIIGEDGAKLILPTKNIYKIGKNAITIKNNQAVTIKVDTTGLCLCPISSKAYSINGEFLGVITEITFSEKFIVDKLSLDNDKTLDISNIASCGKNTVIFNNSNTKTNLKKFMPIKEPKLFKTELNVETQIMPIEELNTNIEPVEKVKVVESTEFLIGRKCLKNIFNFNNELLIKQNEIVNKKNLKEIKRFGKLRELMLYCK